MSSQAPQIFWSNDSYEVRAAKSNHEFRVEWWAFMRELGWNRGYGDLDTWSNFSLGAGMILLMDKKSGRAVGHIGSIINENSTGWVAAFVIDKDHRSKGLGRPLFQAALDDMKNHGVQTVGLDAVVEQKGTYERRGFVASQLGTVKIMTRPLATKVDEVPELSTGAILDIRQVPQKLLAEDELKYTGFARPKLWTNEVIFDRADVQGVAYAASSALQTVDDLFAWVVIRRCSSGARIGPVYARDTESAKIVLLAAIKAVTPGWIKDSPLPHEPLSDWPEDKIEREASFSAEVWSGNPDAVKLFEGCGWQDSGIQYFRMWVDNKATPPQNEGGAAQKGAFAMFDAATG